MIINWIEFENLETGLKIEKIHFNEGVNLLVGISGAGKTQILNSIKQICFLAIAATDSVHDKYIQKAAINFTYDNTTCTWEYELGLGALGEYFFEYEKLTINNKVIFNRSKSNEITIEGFENVPTPKSNESLISQYRGVDSIKPVYNQLIGVVYKDNDYSSTFPASKYRSLEPIIKYIVTGPNEAHTCLSNGVFNLVPFATLGVIKELKPELFFEILELYSDIFNEVQDINYSEDPQEQRFRLMLKINDTWIDQKNISCGMLKVLNLIISVVTSINGTVFLIDEYENSLGVNCMDELTDLLLEYDENKQYLISSHHPYIINNIDLDKWRIITRSGNVIKSRTAKEMNIIEGHREGFFKLINALQFEGEL